MSQYPSPLGTPALRGAAAGYLERRFGVAVDPDRQVVPATGAKEAIFHLPLAFAGGSGGGARWSCPTRATPPTRPGPGWPAWSR